MAATRIFAIARDLDHPSTDVLRVLRDMGITVLLAEQNMHFCLGIATEAAVIDKGQIVYAAGIEDLKANDEIRRRYLAL